MNRKVLNQGLKFWVIAFSLTGLLSASFVYAQSSVSMEVLIKQLQEQVKLLQTQITELKSQLEVAKKESVVTKEELKTTKEEVREIKEELKLTKALKRGETGEEVTKLQEFLKQFSDIYPEGLVTGYYGVLTEKAVKRFQEKNQIVVSGTPETTGYGQIGPKTIAKVNEFLTAGVISPGLTQAPGIEKKFVTTTPQIPHKITICHIPPGNSNNRQTLDIDSSALGAHIAHGDSAGECIAGAATTTPPTTATTTPLGIIPAVPAIPADPSSGTPVTPAVPTQPATTTATTTTPLSSCVTQLTPPVSYPATAPIISNVQASVSTSQTVLGQINYTFTWTTDKYAHSGAEWKASCSSAISHAGSGNLYDYSISHSKAEGPFYFNTSYYYRVKSRDESGNLRESEWYTFTTPASATTPAPAPSPSPTPTPTTSTIATTTITLGSTPITPTNLTYSLTNSNATVILSWTDNSTNETRFEILKRVQGSFVYIGQVGVNVTTFFDSPTAGSHEYDVRACNGDAVGAGCSNSPPPVTVTVGGSTSDTTPPSVPTGVYLSSPLPGYSAVNLYWDASTDNVGVAGYKVYLGGSFLLEVVSTLPRQVNNLSSGYSYSVAAFDASGNVSAQSAPVSVTTTTAADTTPPMISQVGGTNYTSNSVSIIWTTNEASDSQVEYGLTTSYGSVTSLDANLVTSHSVSLSQLQNNTTYYFRVKSKDTAGNLATSASWVTTNDTIPPIISSVLSSDFSSANDRTIRWTTDEASDSQVEYGLTSAYGNSSSLDSTLVSSHSVSISGLSCGYVAYHFRVKSKDASGNLSASPDFSFSTTACASTATTSAVSLERDLAAVLKSLSLILQKLQEAL